MANNYRQGNYVPKHPEKYVGNINNIKYRSSWELELNKFFDGNPNVVRWASEEIAIPYIKPTDGRVHNYFPDYWVEYRTTQGELVQEIMECKPIDQTHAPRANRKQNLYEKVTFAINTAKWLAAQEWCKQHGIAFRIITEKSIFK